MLEVVFTWQFEACTECIIVPCAASASATPHEQLHHRDDHNHDHDLSYHWQYHVHYQVETVWRRCGTSNTLHVLTDQKVYQYLVLYGAQYQLLVHVRGSVREKTPIHNQRTVRYGK